MTPIPREGPGGPQEDVLGLALLLERLAHADAPNRSWSGWPLRSERQAKCGEEQENSNREASVHGCARSLVERGAPSSMQRIDDCPSSGRDQSIAEFDLAVDEEGADCFVLGGGTFAG